VNVELQQQHTRTFEELRKVSEEGNEYWFARDLQNVLEYGSWDKFHRVIKRAMDACFNSGQQIDDHFSQVGKMVKTGSGASRSISDYLLSRYACYLIVQNGDPAKPVIANGQTYFAIQTRRQEIVEQQNFQSLSEDQKRVMLRSELREHNKDLVATAQKSGVETTLDFAIFQDHGYRGLYGGLGAKDIHRRKELKKSQKILDHMGSTELAANLFRATQTEEKLRRDNVQGKTQANLTHQAVGAKIRQTIKELGGTMPEDLPTPRESIKKLERIQKKINYPGSEGEQ
jgi:DNA-damage-inducible protein D